MSQAFPSGDYIGLFFTADDGLKIVIPPDLTVTLQQGQVSLPDEAVCLIGVAFRMRAEPQFIIGMKRWLLHNANHFDKGLIQP